MKVRQAHGGDAEVIARLLGELGYPTPPDQVRDRLHALSDADRVLLAASHLLEVSSGRRPERDAAHAAYRAARFADGADRSVRYRKELATP
jgi:hypothetical protein